MPYISECFNAFMNTYMMYMGGLYSALLGLTAQHVWGVPTRVQTAPVLGYLCCLGYALLNALCFGFQSAQHTQNPTLGGGRGTQTRSSGRTYLAWMY